MRFQERRKFFLAGWGEGAKALSLAGGSEGLALRKDLLQQCALASFERGNPLSRTSRQRTEVLLHVAKIAEQAACRALHLKETILHLRIVEQRQVAFPDLPDFTIDGRPLAFQFSDRVAGSVSAPSTI